MSTASAAFNTRLAAAITRGADLFGVPIVYNDGGTSLGTIQAGPPRFSTSPEALLSQYQNGAALTVELDLNPDDIAAPEIEVDSFTLAGLAWTIQTTVPAPSGWHHVTARAVRTTTRGRGDVRERF